MPRPAGRCAGWSCRRCRPGLGADQVQRADAGQFIARHAAFAPVAQPLGHSLLGQGGAYPGQVFGPPGNDANVGCVALVPLRAQARAMSGTVTVCICASAALLLCFEPAFLSPIRCVGLGGGHGLLMAGHRHVPAQVRLGARARARVLSNKKRIGVCKAGTGAPTCACGAGCPTGARGRNFAGKQGQCLFQRVRHGPGAKRLHGHLCHALACQSLPPRCLGACRLGDRRLQINRSSPFFAAFCPIGPLWGCKSRRKLAPAGADFHHRRPKSDRLPSTSMCVRL